MKYIAIIILALLITSCKQEATKQEATVEVSPQTENELTLTDDQLKTVEIDHVSLQKKEISGTLQLNGKVDVDPDYKVSLSSSLGGHIKSVRALPGKFVKKGEVILTLEDNQFIQIQQDYLTTQAKKSSTAVSL
jgi:cobalt-zinc-cadmium efflux system membrane fusion protein